MGKRTPAAGPTAPLGSLTRSYIVYRSRDPQLGSRALRRGWERVQ